MLVSDYLNNPKLKTIEMNAIEDKENFNKHVLDAARLLMGGDVPDVVYTNVKKFKKNPLFSNASFGTLRVGTINILVIVFFIGCF